MQPVRSDDVQSQLRALQTALSINKSELARVLRVSRPTVCEWIDGGQPSAESISRIRTVLGLLSESRVSANNPLFPRFVRSRVEAGDTPILDLLCEEAIEGTPIRKAIRCAKALGDAIDSERERREARLRAAGFEEPDFQQRKTNLARNVALMRWPRE